MSRRDTCPHCGVVLRMERSLKAHRHYFAVIKMAYDNWPEDNEFQPDGPRHLRKWLEVEARHRDVIEQDMDDPDAMLKFTNKVIAAASNHGYARIVSMQGALIAHVPRSIDFSSLSQEEFTLIANEVYSIIEERTHLSIAQLKLEADKHHGERIQIRLDGAHIRRSRQTGRGEE